MATNSSIVVLTGRVGGAPKTQTNSNNKLVAGLSLAVDDDQRQADGSWSDRTMWFWVEGYNALAERMSKLEKGSLLVVTGKLKQSEYEQNGVKITKTKVWADSIRVVSKPAPAAADPAPFPSEVGCEDIPF